MNERDKVTLRGKGLVSRLTGISTPAGRIQRELPSEERDRAKISRAVPF